MALPLLNRNMKAYTEEEGKTPRNQAQAKAHAWSLSFIEASKHQARKKLEAERVNRWTAGNHDSTSFFRRMGESLADTNTVKAHCKAAVEASPSRNAEEKVSMDHIQRRIEEAKALCAYSRGCIIDDEATGKKKVLLEGTAFAPYCLSHLEAPGQEQKQQVAATKVQSIFRGRNVRKQVIQSNHKVEKTTIAAGAAAQPEEQKPESASMEAPCIPCSSPSEVAPLPLTEDSVRAASGGDDDGGLSNFGEDSRSQSKEPTFQGKLPSKTSQSEDNKTSRSSKRATETEGSDSDSDKSKGDDWPPKPPILRFRAQCQFSTQFKTSEQMEVDRKRRKEEEDKKKQLQKGTDTMEDYTLTWVNMFFKMEVDTENQYHAAFPLILLSMIDVIYPKKVRWHQVDWNAGYVHALQRNHAVLEQIWKEVNMDKLKDFRKEYCGMSLEDMMQAEVDVKLAWLKLVKRWFDQRVQYSGAYDPIHRRTEIERGVRLTGRYMKFPSWMRYDKEAVENNRKAKPDPSKKGYQGTENTTEYDKMPEFKRLIWFLGSADHTEL